MIFEKNKCDIRDRQHLIHNGTYNLHTFDNFFEGGTVRVANRLSVASSLGALAAGRAYWRNRRAQRRGDAERPALRAAGVRQRDRHDSGRHSGGRCGRVPR